MDFVFYFLKSHAIKKKKKSGGIAVLWWWQWKVSFFFGFLNLNIFKKFFF